MQFCGIPPEFLDSCPAPFPGFPHTMYPWHYVITKAWGKAIIKKHFCFGERISKFPFAINFVICKDNYDSPFASFKTDPSIRFCSRLTIHPRTKSGFCSNCIVRLRREALFDNKGTVEFDHYPIVGGYNLSYWSDLGAKNSRKKGKERDGGGN